MERDGPCTHVQQLRSQRDILTANVSLEEHGVSAPHGDPQSRVPRARKWNLHSIWQ